MYIWEVPFVIVMMIYSKIVLWKWQIYWTIVYYHHKPEYCSLFYLDKKIHSLSKFMLRLLEQ